MEHYYHIKNLDDLEKLKYIDPMPYHEKSVELWNNYLRPDKAVERLLSHLS
jgi:hypothetical protein